MTYGEWISKANASEDWANGPDRKAHLFPINTDMFLEAAKYSRKSAHFQLLASQVARALTKCRNPFSALKSKKCLNVRVKLPTKLLTKRFSIKISGEHRRARCYQYF